MIRSLFCPQDSKEAVAIQVLKDQPHLFLQQTSTLDYVKILSGELYLTLEEEETILKAGVIVLKCRTYVAWSNLSDKPAIQLAILLVADYD